MEKTPLSRSFKANLALPGKAAVHDPLCANDDDWELGAKRQRVIVRLQSLSKRSTEDIKKAAKELECSERLVWLLLAEYRKKPQLTTLIPKPRNGGRGKSRLLPEVDEIIEQAIKNFYLKSPHALVSHLVREVHYQCHKRNIPKPSSGTVKNRLKQTSKHEITRRKRGSKEAQDIYAPIIGKTPDTQYPLQRIQIDHTRFDGIVVDSFDREPVGRPWITIFQDEYSRAVIGYYLTLEHPKTGTLAIGIAHSILPKDVWAKNIGLEVPWTMQGIPELFYTDNAKEFVTPVVKRGCEEWGMRPPEQRPKRFAHFGGIIERTMKTAMQEARLLPGSTASNPRDKGDYDAVKGAVLTLEELDLWLATFFAGEYNIQVHSHTGLPPAVKWQQGFEGIDDEIGLGGPRLVDDPEKLFIDFLPYETRKIQRYGVQLWYIQFWNDAMQYFLDRGDKREFVIRYDPRDISKVWFLNPLDGKYYVARTHDLSRPKVTYWDWQAHTKKLRENGQLSLDEDTIFRSYGMRKDIVSKAKNKTSRQKARRTRERTHQAKLETGPKLKPKSKPVEIVDPIVDDGDEFPEFYDIEKWS